MKIQSLFLSIVIVIILCANCLAQESNTTRERRTNTSGPSAEATVTINEQFLNAFIISMFDNLKEPSMPLTIGGAQSSSNCASEIRLKREINGTRTAVRLENGKIAGTLAFAGAYNQSLMGCIEFTGSANADVNLEYDANRRAVLARFYVREIHLNKAPSTVATIPSRSSLLKNFRRASRFNPRVAHYNCARKRSAQKSVHRRSLCTSLMNLLRGNANQIPSRVRIPVCPAWLVRDLH